MIVPSLEVGSREPNGTSAKGQDVSQAGALKSDLPLQSTLQGTQIQAIEDLSKDSLSGVLSGQIPSAQAASDLSFSNPTLNGFPTDLSSGALHGDVIPDFSQWSAELQSVLTPAEPNPVRVPAFANSNPLSGSDYLNTIEQLQSTSKNPAFGSKFGLNQPQAALGASVISPDGKFDLRPRGLGKDSTPGFRYLDGSEIHSGVQVENSFGVQGLNPWDAILPPGTAQQAQFQSSGQSQNSIGMPGRGDPLAELGLVDSKKKGGLSEDRLAGISSQVFLGNSGGVKNLSMPLVEMNAQVTTGSGAKQRLSTESLMNVSGQIRSLASSGGGEIRVRLRPNDLGELNIRVMTQGSRVGIQIQAADEKAKKMIEDSVGYLKESLSAQNLSLSRVDLSVLSAGTKGDAGTSGDSQQNTNPWNLSDPSMQQNSGQFLGRHEGQGSRSGAFGEGSFEPTRRTQVATPAFLGAQRMGRGSAAQGRIDVTA